MTLTAGTAPRQNRDGHPCPPWCRTDHQESRSGTCVGGGSIGNRDLPDGFWTRAVRICDRFEVSVHGSTPDPDEDWPSLNLNLRDAGNLAGIVELLADATPDQHRELAAAIRQAVADITEAGDA